MKNRVLAILIAAAAATFQGCLFSSGNDGTGVPKGMRRPNAPVPTYTTEDSLVHIQIPSRRAGEERFYWIYRDGKLLDQPEYAPVIDGVPSGFYYMTDSVPKPGTYTFTVKYGEHRDTLSDPSKPYVFKYEGPSPSGQVYLDQPIGVDVIGVRHRQGRNFPLRRVIIERKVNADGDVTALDTLETDPSNPWSDFVDTNLVTGEYTLYYRAVGQGLDEDWLKPSPWDSVKVSTGPWTYIPLVRASNHGTDVEVRVDNVLTGGATYTYYLWRNGRSAKDGAVLVDSLVAAGDMLPILADVPTKVGTYWYWVDVQDGRGRRSARSNPLSVRFTGRPGGPEIRALSVGTTFITIEFEPSAGVLEYVIERTQDTTKASTYVKIDSLEFQPGTAVDRPPRDGYWYYRVSAILPSGPSDPGPWSRSGFYAYRPVIQQITASFVNRGDRVEVSPSFGDWGLTYVLFRSAHPAGRDSVAVDTTVGSDFSSFTPSLQDKPAAGVWYYQLQAWSGKNVTADEYRTEWVRVEFTGKSVGPEVTSASVQTSSVLIQFRAVREAIAYVVERAKDGSTSWSTIDTIQASPGDYLQYLDRPPEDGYWQYRVRMFLQDLSLSPPGASRRTNGPWNEAAAFSNTLSVNLVNGGTYVEVTGLFPEWQYTYYLLRSVQADFKGGAVIDSLPYGATPVSLNDAPEKGTYYYWVERRYAFLGGFPPTIYRSMPIKVVFTGIPEIGNLSQEGNAIRINLPPFPENDILQVFRSAGNPADAASFTMVAESNGGIGGTFYDQDLDLTKAAFYHYKLVMVRDGKPIQGAQVRSFYFVPR